MAITPPDLAVQVDRIDPPGVGQPVHRRGAGDAGGRDHRVTAEAPPSGTRAFGCATTAPVSRPSSAPDLRSAVLDQAERERPRAGAVPPDPGGPRREHRPGAVRRRRLVCSRRPAGPRGRRSPRMSAGVLIVDDDDALAENVAEIVEMLGAETTIARDRKAALALAATRDFDVALIDVGCPTAMGCRCWSRCGPGRRSPSWCWSPGTRPSRGRSRRCGGTRSPTCSSRSLRPTCSTRFARRSIRRPSTASESACARTWNAPSAATAIW